MTAKVSVVAIGPYEEMQLRAVYNGLFLNDERSVKSRARLEAAGLIVHRGWELTPAGKEHIAND